MIFLASDKAWLVSYKHPYDVSKNDQNNQYPLMFNLCKSFSKRIDAEKHSLKLQIDTFKKMIKNANSINSNYNIRKKQRIYKDMSKDIMISRLMIAKLSKKLRNIEDEHPEWMI